MSVFLYGYPGDNKDKLGQLWGMNGNYHFISKNNNELMYYNNIDTSGGQSGSPIFVSNNNILAIHTMGDNLNIKRNYATVLNRDKINWIHNIFYKNNNIKNNHKHQYIALKMDKTTGKHIWNTTFSSYQCNGSQMFNNCHNLQLNKKSYFGIESNNLYVFGWNEVGQLGINKKQLNFNNLIKHNFFKTNNTKIISSGIVNGHCFIYSKLNKLFGFGWNGHSQIGMKTTDPLIFSPHMINYDFKSVLTKIKCGFFHSLFLSQNGSLFGCGNNNCGQLTDNYKINANINGVSIQPIIKNTNIIDINICEKSSYILNKDNQLQSFGSNIWGELGINKPKITSSKKPVKVLNGASIKQFSCGANHIGCLTDTNELYMFGSNGFNECGIKNGKLSHIGNKIILNNNIQIIHVSCGRSHTICKTDDNKYYAFGKNDTNQLLINDTIKSIHIPTMISIDYVHKLIKNNKKIIDFIAGWQNTLIITE